MKTPNNVAAPNRLFGSDLLLTGLFMVASFRHPRLRAVGELNRWRHRV